MTFHSINSVDGCPDNWNLGDHLTFDMGDTLLRGIFDGWDRHQFGEEIKYYARIDRGRKGIDLICIRDWPELRVRRKEVVS